ncbi:hypothetical protein GCM10010833_33350 [Blastomonas aquatica]|uniref:Uncharacterized protein n=1 Tax=Blastomonas aquatica TaxID=1510276 RepID=A0ABQ1JTV7_9SPHN|nr:hypothetical protein GCM10010833_33350 [Blastomonas aquatica]
MADSAAAHFEALLRLGRGVRYKNPYERLSELTHLVFVVERIATALLANDYRNETAVISAEKSI